MNGCAVWFSLVANEKRGYAVTGSSSEWPFIPTPSLPDRLEMPGVCSGWCQELACGVGEEHQKEAEREAL